MSLLLSLLDRMMIGDGCWHWTGSKSHNGYGKFTFKKKTITPHRAMYEMMVGSIPDGLQLDHLCRVRDCARPSHLEPVTNRENSLRGVAGLVNGAREASKTHCPSGHAYDAGNTWLDKERGARHCRTCNRNRSKK